MVTADFSRDVMRRDSATTSEPSADSASVKVAATRPAAMPSVVSTAGKGSLKRS